MEYIMAKEEFYFKGEKSNVEKNKRREGDKWKTRYNRLMEKS